MKLTNPTDDELNAAFAEKVAGWDHFPAGYPRWTHSADAVLPWLEKAGGFHISWNSKQGYEVSSN